jgi:hypothetical protein
MLVRHMWPRTACAGKQYTPSECIKARSMTADDRSQLLPAIQIRIGGIEGICSTRVCQVVSNCVKFCHSHRGHGVFANIIVLYRTSIVVDIHVIGSDRAIIGETDTILGKERMPCTWLIWPMFSSVYLLHLHCFLLTLAQVHRLQCERALRNVPIKQKQVTGKHCA